MPYPSMIPINYIKASIKTLKDSGGTPDSVQINPEDYELLKKSLGDPDDNVDNVIMMIEGIPVRANEYVKLGEFLVQSPSIELY